MEIRIHLHIQSDAMPGQKGRSKVGVRRHRVVMQVTQSVIQVQVRLQLTETQSFKKCTLQGTQMQDIFDHDGYLQERDGKCLKTRLNA